MIIMGEFIGGCTSPIHRILTIADFPHDNVALLIAILYGLVRF